MTATRTGHHRDNISLDCDTGPQSQGQYHPGFKYQPATLITGCQGEPMNAPDLLSLFCLFVSGRIILPMKVNVMSFTNTAVYNRKYGHVLASPRKIYHFLWSRVISFSRPSCATRHQNIPSSLKTSWVANKVITQSFSWNVLFVPLMTLKLWLYMFWPRYKRLFYRQLLNWIWSPAVINSLFVAKIPSLSSLLGCQIQGLTLSLHFSSLWWYWAGAELH